MFGSHDAIGAAIGFSGDDGDFWHGRFRVSVKQFGSVLDDATIFLRGAGKKARDIDKGQQGNIEGVAKADKASSFC